MSIKRLTVTDFIEGMPGALVLDVRSPGEYSHAHIPGASSLPLFTDEERSVVGTTYKQKGRQAAIKLGLDYFGPEMRKMVEQVEQWLQEGNQKKILIHCWRGGMRSGAVAWLLDLYGFDLYVLEGGYKAFRNWVLDQFQKDYPLRLIGGYTGSGKTHVLHQLQKAGAATIDLEGLANHRGSAFGALDRPGQPSAEFFENKLALELHRLASTEQTIWIEDESQRIGDINIPIAFWNLMRTKPLYFLEVPFGERLGLLVKDYGHFKKEAMVNAIIRIKKRLGGLDAKEAIHALVEDDLRSCFAILLRYYDKQYSKSLNGRNNLGKLIRRVATDTADAQTNTKKILNHAGE